MLKRVMFVSRNAIENLAGDWSDFALISIYDPSPAAGMINLKAFRRAKSFHFHDVVPEREYEEAVVHMDEAQASDMVAFLHEIESDVEGVLVNCGAGVSRSAAVAKWTCGSLRIPFNGRYDKYNKHVYKLLCEAEKAWRKEHHGH